MDRDFSVEEMSGPFWPPSPVGINRSPSEWEFEKFLEEVAVQKTSSTSVPIDPSPDSYQRPHPNRDPKSSPICNESASSFGSSSVRKGEGRVARGEDEVVEIKGSRPSVAAQSLQSDPSANPDPEEYAAYLKQKLDMYCAAVAKSRQSSNTIMQLPHGPVSVTLRPLCLLQAPPAEKKDVANIGESLFIGLIVGAFKNLDEMSNRSFPKRVSILETVAKVRSCVLMLDLDCDDLILEMFQHFMNTIRSKHFDSVFSSMETFMTLVLEEIESISAQFLSCLLDGVKVIEKNILHTTKKLAEKVLVYCSLKLKPYLSKLFSGLVF
ncbi:Light-inducible protein CPRF2 [Dendrobium catenatum]|uniref:Light-inducible protein CPRF2 n=1 Tax=Dendrobium catenatum TaxID=906689 RepID=A0A2I0W914_9ASPA|nr:Light-inducible protein CPRF2 [Dendrobium catenatum]